MTREADPHGMPQTTTSEWQFGKGAQDSGQLFVDKNRITSEGVASETDGQTMPSSGNENGGSEWSTGIRNPETNRLDKKLVEPGKVIPDLGYVTRLYEFDTDYGRRYREIVHSFIGWRNAYEDARGGAVKRRGSVVDREDCVRELQRIVNVLNEQGSLHLPENWESDLVDYLQE